MSKKRLPTHDYCLDVLADMKSWNHWRQHVSTQLLYAEKFDALYAACSKNACSTIKTILSNAASSSHERLSGSPHILSNINLASLYDLDPKSLPGIMFGPKTYRFAFVRNPFDRVVSCYFNRIETPGPIESYEDPKVADRYRMRLRRQILSWRQHLHPSAVDPSDEISFQDFVRFICNQQAYDMDRHWYHQSRSIHYDFIEFSKIARVERFQEDMAEILESIGAPRDFEWSQTRVNSRSKRAPERAQNPSLQDLFDKESERLFVEKFREDFENFGYEPCIERDGPKRAPQSFQRQPSPPRYVQNSRAISEITCIIPTVLRDDCLRKLVRSLRRVYGADLQIMIGAQCDRPNRSLAEFAAAYGAEIFFLPADFGLSATRNFLVRKSHRPFILLLDDDFVLHENSNIEGAWSLLQSHTDLHIVGGVLDNMTFDAEGNITKRRWSSHAGDLHYQSDNQTLTLSPVEAGNHELRPWFGGVYVRCDVVLNFALFRRSVFEEHEIWWDESIKVWGEHIDFYLHAKANGDIGIAFYTGMAAEHHKTVSAEYLKRRTRKNWVSYWMKKWRVQHYQIPGKQDTYLDPVTDEVRHVTHRDAQGNVGSAEFYASFYKRLEQEDPPLLPISRSALQSEFEKQLEVRRTTEHSKAVADRRNLAKLQRQLEQLRSSASWKITAPLRYLKHAQKRLTEKLR